MGTTQITVPSGGINIKGYDFNISGLVSTEDNYKMFIGGSAGDMLEASYYITVSGTNSQVYDLTAATGNEATELTEINFI